MHIVHAATKMTTIYEEPQNAYIYVYVEVNPYFYSILSTRRDKLSHVCFSPSIR